jgi:N-acetyl-gamma-glutamyl-phosphate reductase
MSERSRVPVAVVNGTGYGGVELLRLLLRHPTFEVVEVTARSEAGKRVADVFPHLPHADLAFGEAVERAEIVFMALPDSASAETAPALLAEGRRVVDLSAAFRLRDPGLYPRWYGYAHPAPALLDEAVYGVPELVRDVVTSARLVACPGCYPTAALLALAPALRRRLIEPDVIVDAKSGVSGAGRTLKLGSHFSEANEDVAAYGLDGHRHAPEIRQELTRLVQQAALAGPASASLEAPRLTFVPHLVPMTRGILATCYAPLRPGVRADDVADAYADAYAEAPFVRIAAAAPHTKWTLGSNLCFVHAKVQAEDGRLVVVSALDNLVKGAAGQAIQCANLMCGVSETAGLPLEGVYP